MRAVIQRVSRGSVTVDGVVIGEIGQGIMVLLGIQDTDDEKVISYMVDKITHLRIFEDEMGKMNISVSDIKGSLLLVPNFTLYGDCRKGKRPSYSQAAQPQKAQGIFEAFVQQAQKTGLPVATGQFQSDMKVEIVNDGPVTVLVDSDKIF